MRGVHVLDANLTALWHLSVLVAVLSGVWLHLIGKSKTTHITTYYTVSDRDEIHKLEDRYAMVSHWLVY